MKDWLNNQHLKMEESLPQSKLPHKRNLQHLEKSKKCSLVVKGSQRNILLYERAAISNVAENLPKLPLNCCKSINAYCIAWQEEWNTSDIENPSLMPIFSLLNINFFRPVRLQALEWNVMIKKPENDPKWAGNKLN